MSPTGRMGHQECRASQLTGAQITGSAGSEVGTISDVIIDPYSGRVDFAIVSLNASAGTSSGSATTPGGAS
ncbi:MAG: PRC-barrel domain-containing protein [Limisphaerales bacterium]